MTTRRGFFGLFAGALATPVMARLPSVEPQAYVAQEVSYGYRLSLADIVTETLRARSSTIADSLMRTNPLFEALERRHQVHASRVVVRAPAASITS